MSNVPAGFPLARVATWIDENGRPVKPFLYLIQALWLRTGAASGANGGSGSTFISLPPAFLGDEGDGDEPILRGSFLAPGGWFDEKGSGGTYGFASGVDFVAGTTTVLTLSQPYGSQANLIVTFDGTYQGADQFSVSGPTLTFTSAIPIGVSKVYVKGFLMPQ